jgi:hypothetical protein
MHDLDAPAADQDPDHIEPVLAAELAMTVDPDRRGVRQVPALPLPDRTDWAPKPDPPASLDLDECHRPRPADDQVDVAMSDAKPASQHLPPLANDPPFGE